jgi:tetratricopeptide (TPR) repeat protein
MEPSMRHLLPLLIASLLLVMHAGPASAADERPVELPLAAGKTLTGVVKSATGREVVLELGPNRLRRIPWDQLAPLGVYRVKAALSPAADGEARKKLAELAADLGLYAEARTEYEKALALGALTQKEFEQLVRAAEMHAVKAGVAIARHLAEAGDLEGALAAATKLRIHFASAPNAGEINRLVDDLVKLVQRLDKEAVKDQAELAKALVDIGKNKEVLRRQTEALGQMQKGRKASDEAAKAREKGNLTWARKHAETAHENFQDARRNMGRLRRILPRDSNLRQEILGRLVELDKAQFALLYETAYFFWLERVFKRAETWAARASYIDPVDPDLMELREELVSSRIRYRLSDMTNARGIVR